MLSLDEFFLELKKEIKARKGIKYDDVNKICVSSLPYEEKIKLLKELNEDANKIFVSSNITLNNINRGYYDSEMKMENKRIRNNLFWQIPFSLGFTAFNGYNIYEFIDYVIENQNVLELQSQDLLKILVCVLILPITSGIIDVKTIKNYINFKRYNMEINSYQRTLNDNHRNY